MRRCIYPRRYARRSRFDLDDGRPPHEEQQHPTQRSFDSRDFGLRQRHLF